MVNELFEHDFFVTDIVLACHVREGTGEPVHRNRPSHGFAYHIGGEDIYRFRDGTEIVTRDGDLIYLPQFSDYTVRPNEAGDCYAINFLLTGEHDAPPFKLHLGSENVLQCFKRAQRAFSLQKNGYQQICCRELYEIACIIRQEYAEQNYTSQKQRAVLKRAEEYIAARYLTEPISVRALAEHCGVSEVYLRRIFGAVHHLSPVAYINRLRVSYAHALLMAGEYSVSDACYAAGFNDTAYFCRTYKKQYGIPPRETKPAGKNG